MESKFKPLLFYWIERGWPYLLAFITTGLYLNYSRALPPQLSDLLPVVLTVAAIGIGFLSTAKAIIVSIADSEVIAFLKGAGRLVLLIDYFLEAIVALFLLCVITAPIILFDLNSPPFWFVYLAAVWLFLLTASAALTARVVFFFSLALRQAFE